MLLTVVACEREAPPVAPAPATASAAAPPDAPSPDARRLLERFECNRCHEGLGEPVAERRSCIRCHRAIEEGAYEASRADLARYRQHVESFVYAPSLEGVGRRLRAEWIERYLLAPHDVRPALPAQMPRLALAPEEARAIALHLAPTSTDADVAPGDVARGLALFHARGCASCHAFTGAALGEADPSLAEPPADARLRAPDLRHVRDRMTRAMVDRWIADPRAIDATSVMPSFGLSRAERADVVAFLFDVELAPFARPLAPGRPPPLGRRVEWDEVARRVFHTTCKHCHADARFALGDGGPGNTGGFGFPARGVDLRTHTHALGGVLGDDGHRLSFAARMPDGTPRLVAVLLARHAEEAGAPVAGLRGMPLALPPVPLEDIRLVDAWIEAGMPR